MIDYDYPPYRPPNEAGSALIRASHGCPWNRCLFCTMYKKTKYQPRPLNDVLHDIDTATHLYPNAKNIFIADSDSLAMKNILPIIEHIKQRFPKAERITSYARAKTLKNLGTEKLKQLHNAGLIRVHVGLESGDEKTLDLICKGATPHDMIHGGKAAKNAGLQLSFYILIGAGGQQHLTQHAAETALVCNQVNPDFIRLRTLIVQHDSLLRKKMNNKEYIPTTPQQKIQELKIFLENLTVHNCELASDHFTNYLWHNHFIIYHGIHGMLPKDKNEMLTTLNKTLSYIQNTSGDILDATILYEQGLIPSL